MRRTPPVRSFTRFDPGGFQTNLRRNTFQLSIRDLALLEEPMAHNVPGTLPLRCGEQFNRRVHMRQIVLRMCDYASNA